MGAVFHGDIAYLSGSKTLVSFKNTIDVDSSATKIIVDTEHTVNSKIAAWGPNNDYPQKLLKQLRSNGAALSGLRVLTKTHYGSGFVLVEESFDDDGKRILTPKSINQYPEIKEFWKKSQMKKFFRETIKDEEYWSLAFPEYILSNNYKKINRVKRQQTANARFEVMNEETGFIENVYFSTKWKDGVNLDSKYVSDPIPLIDPYWSAKEVKEYCKANGIKKFIRPIFYPLVDETYYPIPEWQSINKSGWLEISNSIPEFKKAIFENQINIKYIVEVHEEYFSRRYKDEWENFKTEKREELRKQLVNEIDEHMRGTNKAGGSLMSVTYEDRTGKSVSGIKITPVDDKYKEGSYLPEASAANSEILFALGVDPSLIGAGIPGGKLGAGSGSDKREAFLILTALTKTNRESTLEVFEFIQEYNGWDEKLIGGFEDTVLTTLDKNPTGSQKAAQI